MSEPAPVCRSRRLARALAAPLVLGVLAILAAWVLSQRGAVRLPGSGEEVRAAYLPATPLETVERPASVATLLGLQDASGRRTTAWLRVPRDLDPEYDVLLTYVGHQARRRILDLIPERPDVVLVAMQYAAEYRHETWREKLGLPSTLGRAAEDTVAGGMLALAELERRGFDLDRLTVLGVSLGSFFAVLHGAYDREVPRVLIVHGGGDLDLILRSYYAARGKPWKGRLVGGLARFFLDPLDPLHHVARIAPRRFTMISARGDASFPEVSARLLYEAARPPKGIAWTEGTHVRSRRPDIIEELVVEIDRYLEGNLDLDESAGMPTTREALPRP